MSIGSDFDDFLKENGIYEDAIKKMESVMNQETIKKANEAAKKELKRLNNPLVKLWNWFLTLIHGEL